MLANALGRTVYLRRPGALYRRHEAALTGDYARQSLRDRVGMASTTGAGYYRFLSEVAEQSSGRLRRLAGIPGQECRSDDLRRSGEAFDRLARIQALRAEVYSGSPAARAWAYLRIWHLGGYLGRPFWAMGVLSAAKDLLRVSGLLRAGAD
jgi:hypothetical protein